MTKIIPESELILNSRKAVYHLDLLPEEIADCIITVGDPHRVAAVSKHFDFIEIKKTHREFVTHTGLLGKKRLSVISTGIGTDNIDIVLNELDALVNIDLTHRKIKPQLTSLQIIRIGTTGGLQPFLNTGSIVISKGAFGLDNLLDFYSHKNSGEEFEMNEAFQAHIERQFSSYFSYGNKNLIDHLQAIPNSYCGLTVTCSGFYAPQGRQLRLLPSFSDFASTMQSFTCKAQKILNFEMESSGIYGLGKLLGHQCCSVSVVVANRITQKFSSNPDQDVEKIIKNTLEKIIEP